MAEMRTWQGMRDSITRQLERQTGEDVEAWNRKIAAKSPADEKSLRSWLTEQGIAAYPQMLLVYETFGYPDFLLATADELVEGQYADRPELRPVFDAVVAAISGMPGTEVQARKTYVSLLSPKRTFAIVQATTKKRLDVGLRLGELEPQGRLLLAKSLGNDTITRRVSLESVEDLDDEALGWIRRAYEENV